MILILVTQFNSLYQTLLVLSAIVFSTSGLLLGLLASSQPFGIVMCGIAIIALAGIVVNNNIILIDAYNVITSYSIHYTKLYEYSMNIYYLLQTSLF